jgi:hypothetical protein
MRAITSVGPPGANGTMKCTGLLGKFDCAQATRLEKKPKIDAVKYAKYRKYVETLKLEFFKNWCISILHAFHLKLN